MKPLSLILLSFILALPYCGISAINTSENKVRKSVKKMAKTLSKQGVFIFSLYGDWQKNQHPEFTEFETSATENELILLTDGTDPIIKAYSFFALLRNHFETNSWKKVLEANMCDMTPLRRRSGCIVSGTYCNLLLFDLAARRLEISHFDLMETMGYPKNCAGKLIRPD